MPETTREEVVREVLAAFQILNAPVCCLRTILRISVEWWLADIFQKSLAMTQPAIVGSSTSNEYSFREEDLQINLKETRYC